MRFDAAMDICVLLKCKTKLVMKKKAVERPRMCVRFNCSEDRKEHREEAISHIVQI